MRHSDIIAVHEQDVKGDTGVGGAGGGRHRFSVGVWGGLQRKWPAPDPPVEKISSSRHVFETADAQVITERR